MPKFDLTFFNEKAEESENFFIAGCDEVGRGPLAGPVVAACASLEIKKFDKAEIRKLLKKWKALGVTDSKKLKSEQRKSIIQNFSFGSTPIQADQVYTHIYSENIIFKIIVKEIHAEKIDEINILQASLLAMKEAMLGSCPDLPGLVLIDGNRKFKNENEKINLEAIIKGDSKSLLIGLASIVAKEYRDLLMKDLGARYPEYGWEHNAGYPTGKHLAAIDLLGVTQLHRLTFRGVKEVYEERGYRGV
jgi:ribonuclease HII